MVIDDWEGNLSELKKVHPNWFWTAYPDGETWVYSGKSARYSCQVLVFPLIKILRDPLEDREVYKWFVQMKGTGVILPYDDFRRGKPKGEKVSHWDRWEVKEVGHVIKGNIYLGVKDSRSICEGIVRAVIPPGWVQVQFEDGSCEYYPPDAVRFIRLGVEEDG